MYLSFSASHTFCSSSDSTFKPPKQKHFYIKRIRIEDWGGGGLGWGGVGERVEQTRMGGEGDGEGSGFVGKGEGTRMW